MVSRIVLGSVIELELDELGDVLALRGFAAPDRPASAVVRVAGLAPTDSTVREFLWRLHRATQVSILIESDKESAAEEFERLLHAAISRDAACHAETCRWCRNPG